MKKFDLIREQLEQQYLNINFDKDSGLSGKQLRVELDRHCKENLYESRIMTRAWLFYLICTQGRIAVESDDYFADKVEHHNMLIELRNKWKQEEDEKEFKNATPLISGSLNSMLDLSHTSPDWENLLKHGLTGMRDKAAAKSGEFHEAVTMVYDAAALLAKRLGEASGNVALAALGERQPQTFREALQLAYLYHELQEMEGEPVRSMGRFDTLYCDFYSNDIKSGSLDRDEAKELLKFFWIKFYAKTQGKAFGKNFLFGPEVNELSYLGFEAYREMQTINPKLSVRLSPETPDAFLKEVVGCIQSGNTSVVISNDSKTVEMLMKNGKTIEDANNYILIGCYEPSVMGKEMCCSGAAAINLVKSIELTLAQGDYSSFDDFLNAYIKMLDSQITLAAERTRRQELMWPRVNPSPLLSGTMEACLEKGLDVSNGGAKYNTTGVICSGLANAVDSLAVIRQLVYEKKHCTLVELKTALSANWKGHEELRLTAQNRVPKWGNNDSRVDDLAVLLTNFLGTRINREPNARGGVFQAALYSIIVNSQNFGKLTGALPDGHLAGETLALNTGAMFGKDKNGVTSLINSVTKINLSQFPSGSVLDIMLHPSAVNGEDGTQAIIAIIHSYFEKGGMAIQFNIFDADVLRDAQLNPEKYAGLQVRVCGWNVYFADLSLEEQNIFITKAEVA